MSDWELTNKTGYSTWSDSQVTWSDPLVSWSGLLDVWTKDTKNTSTFTYETKNVVSSTEQELLIDDTWELDIGDGFTLSIQSEGAGYSMQVKNTSTFTYQDRGNPKLEDQELLIDDNFELLIDNNYSLQIQEGGIPEDWQLQTKN